MGIEGSHRVLRSPSAAAPLRVSKMGKGKGQAPQFDLTTALTRKEQRTIRKCEGMVQYNLARCPNYGVFESPEYARAEDLKKKIKDIEAKARKRWENNF